MSAVGIEHNATARKLTIVWVSSEKYSFSSVFFSYVYFRLEKVTILLGRNLMGL